MLAEYFSIHVSDDGHLETIPLLLKGYLPCMAKLPTFLLRLGPFVDWTDEEGCFRTFLKELASFYVPEVLPPTETKSNKGKEREKEVDEEMQEPEATQAQTQTEGAAENTEQGVEEETTEKRRKEIEYTLEHVLFPAFRSQIIATEVMLKGVVEVANLKGLYRVFERC